MHTCYQPRNLLVCCIVSVHLSTRSQHPFMHPDALVALMRMCSHVAYTNAGGCEVPYCLARVLGIWSLAKIVSSALPNAAT